MKEFMLFVKTEGDHLAGLSPQEQQNHVTQIGNYIGKLVKEGKLKGAQPLEISGVLVQGNKGVFKDGPYSESKEVIVGYFHVLANNLSEAVEIAKANPLFQVAKGSIEVRPIKTMEEIN